ncbi:MAG: glycosyltransferase family 9 protein [Deltaproteobacteria bacterium]|nr:glycosyltransferase family 9 protein [Deltaproteobacteria bacterium]
MNVKSVLFIRRDNIGDLVCTTPAIRAVRIKYPRCRIALLVNSYNAGVVRNNPDVNDVYVYEKFKHQSGGSRFTVWLDNLRLIGKIRRASFDVSIACGYAPSSRLARFALLTGARMRIGPVFAGNIGKAIVYTHPIDAPQGDKPIHEVQAMMRLLAPLGIKEGLELPLLVKPDEIEVQKARAYLKTRIDESDRLIAIHISSRRPQNRWPVERFKALADVIQGRPGHRVLLLWSPGEKDNPLHPGDDEAAAALAGAMKKEPIAYRTRSVEQLIAVLSMASMVVCCDGGAMHIAAGLGKPVLTIWGSTDKRRWSPWGVPSAVVQNGREAASVGVDEVIRAFDELSGVPA